MATSQNLLVASLLLLSSLAVVVHGHNKVSSGESFHVEGKVYCDSCRAGFETTITEYLSGAEVKLECRNTTSQKILYVADAVTDSSGTYSIEVARRDDDDDDEMCEVVLSSSPLKHCSEIKKGRDRATVAIAGDAGMSSKVRYVNSLGFLRNEPLQLCGQLLAQYALGDAE